MCHKMCCVLLFYCKHPSVDVYREMTPVSIGDVVHLEGQSEGGSWLMDREKGFLVLLPDSLISGTSISSSIRCMRRAVLGDIFKVKEFNFILTQDLLPSPSTDV